MIFYETVLFEIEESTPMSTKSWYLKQKNRMVVDTFSFHPFRSARAWASLFWIFYSDFRFWGEWWEATHSYRIHRAKERKGIDNVVLWWTSWAEWTLKSPLVCCSLRSEVCVNWWAWKLTFLHFSSLLPSASSSNMRWNDEIKSSLRSCWAPTGGC